MLKLSVTLGLGTSWERFLEKDKVNTAKETQIFWSITGNKKSFKYRFCFVLCSKLNLYGVENYCYKLKFENCSAEEKSIVYVI